MTEIIERPLEISIPPPMVGEDYICTRPFIETCKDHLYRVDSLATDVPSRQYKVVLLGLSGPDEGRYYSCSLDIFTRRFKKAA